MQRPVLIKIVGTQTEPGGQEQVLELTTLGTYSCEEGIHQLEYEILPEIYQRYEAIEDVLNVEFTKEY